MPVQAWGPSMNTHRMESAHYTAVANSDTGSAQIQWNSSYTPGYITSIATGLSQLGSRNALSDEGSATESQLNLPNASKLGQNEDMSPM